MSRLIVHIFHILRPNELPLVVLHHRHPVEMRFLRAQPRLFQQLVHGPTRVVTRDRQLVMAIRLAELVDLIQIRANQTGNDLDDLLVGVGFRESDQIQAGHEPFHIPCERTDVALHGWNG